MIGLKRGTVALEPHQEEWHKNAKETIAKLQRLLGSAAIDIQHIGSTAVRSIHAKPIIDLVVGVRSIEEIEAYISVLEQHGFLYRGEDVAGQRLFVMAGPEQDTRTHHIHMVEWDGAAWKNYIDFRDYLNAFEEKAAVYDRCKQRLAAQFPQDRGKYTAGKQELIDRLLEEARAWRHGSRTEQK